jgi:hypothetical protein
MTISLSCPISGDKRDNNTVRVVAAETLLIALVAEVLLYVSGVLPAALLTGILALDFIIRAFIKPRYSPLATLARLTTSALKLPKIMVDSAPKIFAARVGVLFSVSATILFALGLSVVGAIVLGILIICAFLESVLSFCMGCWLYARLPKKLGDLFVRELRSA